MHLIVVLLIFVFGSKRKMFKKEKPLTIAKKQKIKLADAMGNSYSANFEVERTNFYTKETKAENKEKDILLSDDGQDLRKMDEKIIAGSFSTETKQNKQCKNRTNFSSEVNKKKGLCFYQELYKLINEKKKSKNSSMVSYDPEESDTTIDQSLEEIDDLIFSNQRIEQEVLIKEENLFSEASYFDVAETLHNQEHIATNFQPGTQEISVNKNIDPLTFINLGSNSQDQTQTAEENCPLISSLNNKDKIKPNINLNSSEFHWAPSFLEENLSNDETSNIDWNQELLPDLNLLNNDSEDEKILSVVPTQALEPPANLRSTEKTIEISEKKSPVKKHTVIFRKKILPSRVSSLSTSKKPLMILDPKNLKYITENIDQEFFYKMFINNTRLFTFEKECFFQVPDEKKYFLGNNVIRKISLFEKRSLFRFRIYYERIQGIFSISNNELNNIDRDVRTQVNFLEFLDNYILDTSFKELKLLDLEKESRYNSNFVFVNGHKISLNCLLKNFKEYLKNQLEEYRQLFLTTSKQYRLPFIKLIDRFTKEKKIEFMTKVLEKHFAEDTLLFITKLFPEINLILDKLKKKDVNINKTKICFFIFGFIILKSELLKHGFIKEIQSKKNNPNFIFCESKVISKYILNIRTLIYFLKCSVFCKRTCSIIKNSLLILFLYYLRATCPDILSHYKIYEFYYDDYNFSDDLLKNIGHDKFIKDPNTGFMAYVFYLEEVINISANEFFEKIKYHLYNRYFRLKKITLKSIEHWSAKDERDLRKWENDYLDEYNNKIKSVICLKTLSKE
ncbi:hypothetical protein TUBRATIS_004200 [Tubulinosema ratisbonensis]|uniref:Uncharacterized protein n=1 Tax=Tubulinosema ratisbonensis TaxID=291195 RepID=A0A437AP90_9MICR|nr:hypothetical protein TUBRATIS_004200 [Tubulinosema ratisbonensis]